MINPSQTAFLEALGWTIVNSLWQFGILWILFLLLRAVLPALSAARKYSLALLFLLGGLCWMIFSFYVNLNSPVSRPFSWLPPDAGSLYPGRWYATWNGFFNLVLPYCSMVYLAWLGWNLLRFSGSFFFRNRLQKTSLQKAPVAWRLFMRSMAKNMNIRTELTIWITEKTDTPLITGWLKPVLLFPASSLTWLSQDQLESIIIHELAHIRRNDYFWNLTILLAEIFLKFNPFACLFIHTIRKERENACDDWVLRFPYRPAVYAEALLTLEQQRALSEPQLFLAARGSDRKALLNRVKRILDMPGKEQEIRMRLPVLLLFTGLFSLSCLLSPLYKAPTPVFTNTHQSHSPHLVQQSKASREDARPGASVLVKQAGYGYPKRGVTLSSKQAKNPPARKDLSSPSQASGYHSSENISPLVFTTDNNEERTFSLTLIEEKFPSPEFSKARQFPYVPASSFEVIEQRPDSLEALVTILQDKLHQVQFKEIQLQEIIAITEEGLQNTQDASEAGQLRTTLIEALRDLKKLQSKQDFQQDQLARKFAEQAEKQQKSGIRKAGQTKIRPIVHF